MTDPREEGSRGTSVKGGEVGYLPDGLPTPISKDKETWGVLIERKIWNLLGKSQTPCHTERH